MYISNDAIILPVCNIRVEICLYIIIALPPLAPTLPPPPRHKRPPPSRVILLFYPFLTFLDLVFLHKIFVKTYN